MKLFYVGLLGLFVLTGCAQNQYNTRMTPTQVQYQATRNIIQGAQKAVGACLDSLRNSTTNPETFGAVNLVDKEVLFAWDTSPNKVSLMASQSKITEVQKNALLQYIQALQPCTSIYKRDLQSLPSLSITFESYYAGMDIVYAKLLSRQINIGDANQEKAKLINKLQSEFSVAAQNLDSRYVQQINQEIQAAQADSAERRAIASQYLMNQQLINSRQYQAPTTLYQMPSLQAPAPMQPPTTTNCRMIGNTLNCTTN